MPFAGAVAVGAGSLVLGALGMEQSKEAAAREADLQRRAGEARKAAAEFEASVLETQSGLTVASSQRDMLDVQRQARLVQSRAIAVAAASGGGASSPTVATLYGNIAKEGAYNAARALYAGEEKARLMRLQAIQARKMGEFYQVSGDLSAQASEARGKAAEYNFGSTIVGTAGGLYGKYGGKGPVATPTSDFYYSGTGAGGDYQYG